MCFRGHPSRWRFRRQEVGVGGPPTERKGAAHELPVVPDSEIRPYLVLCPAQSLLDLLVALLYPHPQPVRLVTSATLTGDLSIFDPPGISSAQCGTDTRP